MMSNQGEIIHEMVSHSLTALKVHQENKPHCNLAALGLLVVHYASLLVMHEW
jgi:hypothetical protein